MVDRDIGCTSSGGFPERALNGIGQINLRNFTRSLTLTGKPIPEHLRLEYELWSDKLQLGRYVLDLEIHH